MNDDDLITSSMTYQTNTGILDMSKIAVTTGTLTNTITGISGMKPTYVIVDDVLDRYSFNKITVDHKVQEQELIKLKETVPTYADEIKENLARNMSRDVMKKMTFTKKHDKDADVHHFLGRVWVFTEDELKQLIEDVKNA